MMLEAGNNKKYIWKYMQPSAAQKDCKALILIAFEIQAFKV